ncbi:hypothetical protein MXD63_04580 [Frankia sp. Cpl3]|nr:hypothetical protein [Frankia sp. Cpl3]
MWKEPVREAFPGNKQDRRDAVVRPRKSDKQGMMLDAMKSLHETIRTSGTDIAFLR